ncbi:uncharacterized protein MONOS_9331 [Monocercomonoides exilis]|uniref:uncharacterized protein n=1 Tax=Monocercomonoides exilis TaxID=2049356 RepID=UPI003559C988|nr:hypothetical protein MONOS_9331 [Monocercomonoides exilis]|eukprot:MONOS_9331.1-p1 / transcript=MONOS_9331.1 / gene=MONOS_9331 / organism=Monocercomonoides_exilis_PA203 / gene_product=unspecified product / transcript_product=unspecified product / location=Mono_scaffold00381:28772-30836(-) / protein_length=457 / sequence_SO=supercontig / SO=protein_coding / is_pseudo=false
MKSLILSCGHLQYNNQLKFHIQGMQFDYSSMTGDNNLFVGSDSHHSNKDLFMFLVPYNSMEIFISSEGFDVARCGSEEEPCFTTWKGMKNMKKEENATISVRVVMIVDCQIGGEESKEESGSLVVDMWMVSVKCIEIQKESCGSEEGSGRELKCEVAEGVVVVVENSTFEGCSARGSEEKGGGMCMSVVGESCSYYFEEKGCVFERNRAGEGADMFVVCEDLNATILPKRFDMELVGEDGVSKVELRGRDDGRFARESVDLLLFLVKFSGDEVHVSEGRGMDVLGRGKEEIACEMLWCGIVHLKEESEQKEQKVVVIDRCVVSDCFVYERRTIICGHEAEKAKQAKMHVEWELKSNGCEAVMWSDERLSVRMFAISLPQVFGTGQSIVLGTEGGVVNVLNVGGASFENVPFAVHSSVFVESFEGDGVTSERSREGGVMEIELSGEEKTVLRSAAAE